MNISVLTKKRQSEKNLPQVRWGHTLYNSGSTGKQRNIDGVKFLVCADEKPASRVAQFESRLERAATPLLDHNGTRIGICAAYAPTEA